MNVDLDLGLPSSCRLGGAQIFPMLLTLFEQLKRDDARSELLQIATTAMNRGVQGISFIAWVARLRATMCTDDVLNATTCIGAWTSL